MSGRPNATRKLSTLQATDRIYAITKDGVEGYFELSELLAALTAPSFTTLTAPALILSGLTGLAAQLTTYQATVTVLNGATTGKEAAIAMPANFLPFAMAFEVTVAATNACSLTDVGDDVDTDSYCDGIVTNDLTTTGLKGIVGCNGVRGMGDITGGVQVATTTPDEVEVVVSADPGATGVTLLLTFFGIKVTDT